MSDLAPRARSAPELVDAVFQVYRRSPSQFVLGAAIVYVPWLVFRLAAGLDEMVLARRFPASLYISIASLVVYELTSAVCTAIAADVYLGREADVGRALTAVGRTALAVLVSLAVRLVATAVAAVFLLLPALYPLAGFAVTTPPIVLDDMGPFGGLARSWELSKGLKLHILATLFLIWIIGIGVSIGAGFVAGLTRSPILTEVLGTAITAVVSPIYGIVVTLLYYDARIRKEAFDLELLTGTPGPGGVPAAGPATAR